jgi:hypothetical protein
MMVEYRVDCGQQEDISYYSVLDNDEVNSEGIDVDEDVRNTILYVFPLYHKLSIR